MNLYEYLGLANKNVRDATNEVDAAYRRLNDWNLSAHMVEFMLADNGYEAFCWPKGKIVKVVAGHDDLIGRLGITNGYEMRSDARWGVRVKMANKENDIVFRAQEIASADLPDDVVEIAKGAVREEMRKEMEEKCPLMSREGCE